MTAGTGGEKMALKVNLIVAMCESNRGIGWKGGLPWQLPKEYAYFKRLTSQAKDKTRKNAVIMGRGCWESIPAKFRPLRNRINIILSKSWAAENCDNIPSTKYPDTYVCSSYERALELLAEKGDAVDRIWNIGGESVYAAGLSSPTCHRLYVTRILSPSFECDCYFPAYDSDQFRQIADLSSDDENIPVDIQEENGIQYQFTVLEKKKETNKLLSE